MGRMADTVIKQMDLRQREEDEKVRQYEMEREMQERLNDQMSFQKLKTDQQRMRETLARQVEEKKRRERMEKDFNDEQAKLWQMDRELFEQQESELNSKIKAVNMENRNFLESQIGEKEAAKRHRMNLNEHLMNKKLLKDINAQKKSAHGSRVC